MIRKFFNLAKKVFFSDSFTMLMRFTLVLATFIWIYEQNWITVFITILTLLLTYFYIIFAKYKIVIPKEIQVIIIFFIYFSLFLWEVNDFYEKIFWWDTLLHTFAWIALWFIGFLMMYMLYKAWKVKAPKIIISIFAFSFAMMLWAVWEVFEFWVDEFTTANMQKAKDLELIYWYFDTRLGVRDTMYDLMIDWIWATIASITWYIYLKKWEKFKLLHSIIEKFEEHNKVLFNHKK